MANQAVARSVELEPIDRLEEKITLLVSMISRLRAEQARAADDQVRLAQEIDSLRARLSDTEGAAAELISMREERDIIRARVGEMLQQIESLAI